MKRFALALIFVIIATGCRETLVAPETTTSTELNMPSLQKRAPFGRIINNTIVGGTTEPTPSTLDTNGVYQEP